MTLVVLVLVAAWGTAAGVWSWSRTAARRDPRRRPVPVPASGSAGQPGRGGRVVPPGSPQGRHLALAASLVPSSRRRRRVLAALAAALVALTLHPLPALLPLVAPEILPLLLERRRRRRDLAAIVDQLPDVVDLMRLTTLAGLPVSAALLAIDDRPGGVVGAALHHAAGRLSAGATTSDALATLAQGCRPGDSWRDAEPVRPLIDALVDHDRYGTPLGPALDRVGIEARLHRRRQAEEAARRLPVTLLFPLVFTTLPACGLLTVIPLLVASISSLQP